MLDSLRGLLSTVNVGKIRPPKISPQPKLKFLANTVFATFALDTAYLRNETSRRQTEMLMSIYNMSPKIDLVSVTFDPETAEIRLLIVIHPSAAITLQPSKLRHV